MVVYTLEQRWEVGLRSTYKRKILAKNNHVCKRAKLLHLGTENPHAYIEKPTHPKRVTLWCGFWSRGIIEPFFVENEQ